MPGMNTGLNVSNPTLHAAFVTALLHQGIIALLIFTVLTVSWVSIRETQAHVRAGAAAAAARRVPEPSWRKLLRIGFGIIWIVDGLLQAQPAMVIGLPSQVIRPAAGGSPTWVQHLVNWAGAAWSDHPVQAAAAAVWIQVGIGVWLLAARRGALSRLAGLASVGWGLVVWVFGEALGGIFAPGLTLLAGAPGAVLFYCLAGVLIALPERHWRAPRVGSLTLAGMGIFLVCMAVLQAWPGRGFWQGSVSGRAGALAGFVRSMAQTSQPRFLAGWVSGFGSLVAAHGFAVNLFAVVAFGLVGTALLTARPWLARPAVIAMSVLCLADWVLIQDAGVFGGLGTDPNSMIPMALIALAGYLALAPPSRPASAPATEPAKVPAQPERRARHGKRRWLSPAQLSPERLGLARLGPARLGPARLGPAWLSPARLCRALGTADARAVVAIWAVGLTVLGAFPMTAAAASRTADPVIARARNGPVAPVNFKAPACSLTSPSCGGSGTTTAWPRWWPRPAG